MRGLAVVTTAFLIYFLGLGLLNAVRWFGPYRRFYKCQMCSGLSEEPLDFMSKWFCSEKCRALYETGLLRHYTRYYSDNLPF